MSGPNDGLGRRFLRVDDAGCEPSGALPLRIMSRAAISIEAIGGDRYRVSVNARVATSHEVTVPSDYMESIGASGTATERIIEESFRFLLEREPNTSILREFSLPLIERYFPEYREEIGRRMKP